MEHPVVIIILTELYSSVYFREIRKDSAMVGKLPGLKLTRSPISGPFSPNVYQE
jgi:hypothetical protein